MANRSRLAEIHTIEQLLRLGRSHRRNARELGIHRATVAASARTRTAPADPIPTVSTGGAPGRQSTCAPLLDCIRDKLAIGQSAQRIDQDLVEEVGFPGSNESVKRSLRRIRAGSPQSFRRMEKPPGEEAQIDFGQGALTAKPGSSKKQRPHLFRIVLSFSRNVLRGDLEADHRGVHPAHRKRVPGFRRRTGHAGHRQPEGGRPRGGLVRSHDHVQVRRLLPALAAGIVPKPLRLLRGRWRCRRARRARPRAPSLAARPAPSCRRSRARRPR